MAICKSCGTKYSKWTTPVSAREVCRECFEAKLNPDLARPRRHQTPAAHLEPFQVASAVTTVATSADPPAASQKIRINWRSFIPRSRSKAVFVIAMASYCLLLSSFISAWRRVAQVTGPPRSYYLSGTFGDIVELLVLAPLIESLILIGIFELVRRASAPQWAQVFASAAFISVLHAWPWWPHAFIVVPTFCIHAASYAYWRRVSWKHAYWVVVAIHFLNNLLPALYMISRAMKYGYG